MSEALVIVCRREVVEPRFIEFRPNAVYLVNLGGVGDREQIWCQTYDVAVFSMQFDVFIVGLAVIN